MNITARIWFRKGGFERLTWTNIVEGFRAEVISDLPNGVMIHTGACETRQDAINDLIGQLRDHGFTGKLRIATWTIGG
jgi:hypothetical protein